MEPPTCFVLGRRAAGSLEVMVTSPLLMLCRGEGLKTSPRAQRFRRPRRCPSPVASRRFPSHSGRRPAVPKEVCEPACGNDVVACHDVHADLGEAVAEIGVHLGDQPVAQVGGQSASLDQQ